MKHVKKMLKIFKNPNKNQEKLQNDSKGNAFFTQKLAKTTSFSDIVTLKEKNLSQSAKNLNIFCKKCPKRVKK